jgi:hypothetical protein
MGKLIPMLGAVFSDVKMPPSRDKKHNAKPKGNRTTKGEKSVTQPYQQHGELASAADPKPLSDRMLLKEHARHAMRHATEDWVSGRMSTSEHNAIHRRATHVLSGKSPKAYSGPSGERKIKGL